MASPRVSSRLVAFFILLVGLDIVGLIGVTALQFPGIVESAPLAAADARSARDGPGEISARTQPTALLRSTPMQKGTPYYRSLGTEKPPVVTPKSGGITQAPAPTSAPPPITQPTAPKPTAREVKPTAPPDAPSPIVFEIPAQATPTPLASETIAPAMLTPVTAPSQPDRTLTPPLSLRPTRAPPAATPIPVPVSSSGGQGLVCFPSLAGAGIVLFGIVLYRRSRFRSRAD